MMDPDISVSDQLIGAEAAKRLLNDPALQLFFDQTQKNATIRAIGLEDPVAREAHRQLVLAIDAIRQALAQASEYDELARAEEQRARSME